MTRLLLPLLAALPLLAQPKTNVLLIVSDDLNNDLSVYGHPLVKTPNFERLAARGVTFTRAYTQYPVCAPSRASFMTGLYPDQTGVLSNSQHFRDHVPNVVTLPQMFRRNGYFAARVGKIYHYGVPGQIGTSGEDDPDSWEQVVNPKGRDKWDENIIHSIGKPGDFGGTLSWLAADGTDAEQTDAIGAEAMIGLLEDHKDAPFFLAMGFYRPHTPYVAPRKYFEMYPPMKVHLPVEPPNDLIDIPAAAWIQRTYQEQMDELTARQAIQGYYAAISFMDAQLGKLLDTMDRLDLWKNTVVVMTSDHGYHMGEHKLWQKTTLFENSARVPLLVAAPGFEATRGKTADGVVELVDLYPTLADLAGLAAPPHVQGASMRPQLEDPNAPGKAAALTTFISTDRQHVGKERHRPNAQGYSIRTKRWRYTEWGDKAWLGLELYDHDNDPKEFTNLAKDPAYADQVRLMEDLMATRVGRARTIPKQW
ncbi:MAG: sulfatase [Bryobacterales bacterium]